MSYMESKIFIMPLRDTANSEPYEIEFTATEDGKILVIVDERHITFSSADFKKLVKLSDCLTDNPAE
jgi:hypothetical protein